MMQHISLFSGIGGFDLASEWMGWTNVASCEINPFGRKVLDYYWPNAYHHDDIHTLTKELLIEKSNWNEQEPTILTGGFPCQPYSTAGKRLGKEDERHLWPEMLRVIRFVRPRWVVGENVHGIISWNEGMVFDELQADLEAEGYEVWPYVLPACGVNAPHRRDRVWFVAYNNNRDRQKVGFQTRREKHVDRLKGAGFTPNPQHDGHPTTEGGRSDGADSPGREEGQNSTKQFEGVCESGELGGLWDAFNPDDQGTSGGFGQIQEADGEIPERNNDAKFGYTGGTDAPNTERNGLEHSEKPRELRQSQGETRGSSARHFKAESWARFPTQPPIRSRNDGISTELDGITFPKWRNESIKAAGNAIVPQVVLQIFKTIEQFESVYLNPTNANE